MLELVHNSVLVVLMLVSQGVQQIAVALSLVAVAVAVGVLVAVVVAVGVQVVAAMITLVVVAAAVEGGDIMAVRHNMLISTEDTIIKDTIL